MNLEKTRQYYLELTEEELCQCAACRHYRKMVRASCPDLAAYLDALGVDIEKPFEAIPIGPAGPGMLYSGVQYVLMGSPDDFLETRVGDVEIRVTDAHPMTDIAQKHFVIEAAPVCVDLGGYGEDSK